MEEENGPVNFEKLTIDEVEYKTILTRKYKNRKHYKEIERDKVYAFISGIIRKVHIRKGRKIKDGDPLFELEAMKMKNQIMANIEGKVKKVHVKTGERVSKNQLLIEFEIDTAT